MAEAKVRLYVDAPLAAGQAVALAEAQANYLFAVMRLAVGDGVRLFNDGDGEWLATVEKAGKRAGILRAERLLRPRVAPPDLWLVFAPIRKQRLDFLVEKAVELGVSRLCPVETRYSQGERLREDKLRAHVIEAAEQCEATCLPGIDRAMALEKRLADWPADRVLYWADEDLAGGAVSVQGQKGAPMALLIGPEGGFAPEERERLKALPFIRPLSLGPRILRAETAALAGLVVLQQAFGDWRGHG